MSDKARETERERDLRPAVAGCSSRCLLRCGRAANKGILEADELVRLWWEEMGGSVFQSPEWVLAWGEARGDTRGAWIVGVMEGDHAVGVAPLWVDRVGGMRRLMMAGAGVSDYLDVIAAPGREQEVADAVWEHLRAEGGFDVVDLRCLPPESPLNAWAGQSLGLGRRLAVVRHEACPYAVLPPTWEEYRGGLSRNTRSYLSRRERRFADAFGDATRLADDPTEVAEVLEAFLTLHVQRMRAVGLRTPFAKATMQRFMRLVTPRLHAKGWLRLHVTCVEGRIVGVLYCIRYRDRTYYYNGGFDPAFEEYSLGSLQLVAAIRQAIAEGCTEFDLLRGGEAYKAKWATHERQTTYLMSQPFASLARAALWVRGRRRAGRTG